MATKRTWIWIVVGAIGLVVLAFFAFAAGMAYLVMRDLEVRDASTLTTSVDQEFETVRRQFAGQQPLVALDDIGAARPRLIRRPAGPAASRRPETMHIMAFDASDAKIVRLKLPFWLLRLGSSGTIRIGNDSIEVQKLGLTVADLEREGPGLVLDYSKDGDRVLLWTE